MNTAELTNLLSKRYIAPTYAFLTQVRNSTGWARQIRTADALALGLWPSRGIYLEGFEIKISRTDWIKELKQPSKADAIAKYCDKWWLVIADKSVVSLGEVPEDWGLLCQAGGKLVVHKEAKLLKAEPLDKPMLAGILRNVSESMVTRESIKDFISEAKESGKQESKWTISRLEEELARLRKNVEEFEQESGVRLLGKWDWGNVGEAVNDIVSGKYGRIKDNLKYIKERSIAVAQLIEEMEKTDYEAPKQ